MASPPSSATSPPGPAHLALPNKRPTLALPTGQVKSRKASFASATSSTHPLRQTSFPPADSLDSQHALAFSPGAYSPAEDDASRRGKIGRPRKVDRESAARGGTASLVNGDDGHSTTRRGAPTVMTADGEGGGDDDDDDMGEDEHLAGQDSLDMVDLQQEGRKKAIFRNQLREDHEERYDYFNRVKLRTQDVRRVVNQTLSQSVPPNVVTTVSAYAKLFAGIIIEEARMVQAEWMVVEEKRPDGEPNEAFKQLTTKRKRSPLLPDHLREALRRYKKRRTGGTVGFTGMSLEGREVAAPRMGGRRLFR
ncbi:histone-fold-containing protein [Polychaeton citri CBS 116435]|uniref:Histone-fold-containing protein n=1 Tax=Polychaeton citri CBS 116435 TaxID=1314669 RepID=A0A9P4UN32_9PEZI|nr:histone-fold-containing protein [Polychaeton citri CBS 116435]